ncbi:MAG: M48 family metallopeptidase [bacterium]|jgi:Zn-dependent protease with chaperone function
MHSTAGYYDGRVSMRRDAVVTLEPGSVRLSGEQLEERYPLRAIVITTGVGTNRRVMRFPDGGMCDVDDPAFLDAVLRRQGRGKADALVRRWERSLACAAAALLLVAAISVGAVRYGVPALAGRVTVHVPAGVESRMGAESLSILDRIAFDPTALPPGRQEALRAVFRDVAEAASLQGTPRLEFRKGKAIGANALALPGGIVVVTDELVALAKADDEIAAVLSHEAEHVRRRHSMRHLLQNSLTVLLVAGVTGDIASISSLSSTIPTLLIDAKYSRDFEREADSAVAGYLRKRGIPPIRYSDILGRLQAELDRGRREKLPDFRNYLSSHPPTEERMRAFTDGRGAP